MTRQTPGKPTRRTGVVTGLGPRSDRRIQRAAPSGFDWIAVITLAAIGVAAVAWLLSPRDEARTAGPGATATPAATRPSLLPSPTASSVSTLGPRVTDASGPSPMATVEPEPSAEPTVEPLPTEDPTVEPLPTEDPTEEPTTEATPVPTPAAAFTIDSVAEGEAVQGSSIEISGAAPPGATVTRDVPLWFDDHTTARATGRWAMRLSLAPGLNEFRMRLGDDRATEIVLHIRSVP